MANTAVVDPSEVSAQTVTSRPQYPVVMPPSSDVPAATANAPSSMPNFSDAPMSGAAQPFSVMPDFNGPPSTFTTSFAPESITNPEARAIFAPQIQQNLEQSRYAGQAAYRNARLNLSDQGLQLREQAEQERQKAAQQKADLEQQNTAAEQDMLAKGIQYKKMPDGSVQPITDEKGNQVYKPIGEKDALKNGVQYDDDKGSATGIPGRGYVVTRDAQGNLQPVDPDRNVKPEPWTDDNGTPWLVKKNQYNAWEYVDPKEAIASGDPSQQRPAAAALWKDSMSKAEALRDSSKDAIDQSAAILDPDKLGIDEKVLSAPPERQLPVLRATLNGLLEKAQDTPPDRGNSWFGLGPDRGPDPALVAAQKDAQAQAALLTPHVQNLQAYITAKTQAADLKNQGPSGYLQNYLQSQGDEKKNDAGLALTGSSPTQTTAQTSPNSANTAVASGLANSPSTTGGVQGVNPSPTPPGAAPPAVASPQSSWLRDTAIAAGAHLTDTVGTVMEALGHAGSTLGAAANAVNPITQNVLLPAAKALMSPDQFQKYQSLLATPNPVVGAGEQIRANAQALLAGNALQMTTGQVAQLDPNRNGLAREIIGQAYGMALQVAAGTLETPMWMATGGQDAWDAAQKAHNSIAVSAAKCVIGAVTMGGVSKVSSVFGSLGGRYNRVIWGSPTAPDLTQGPLLKILQSGAGATTVSVLRKLVTSAIEGRLEGYGFAFGSQAARGENPFEPQSEAKAEAMSREDEQSGNALMVLKTLFGGGAHLGSLKALGGKIDRTVDTINSNTPPALPGQTKAPPITRADVIANMIQQAHTQRAQAAFKTVQKQYNATTTPEAKSAALAQVPDEIKPGVQAQLDLDHEHQAQINQLNTLAQAGSPPLNPKLANLTDAQLANFPAITHSDDPNQITQAQAQAELSARQTRREVDAKMAPTLAGIVNSHAEKTLQIQKANQTPDGRAILAGLNEHNATLPQGVPYADFDTFKAASDLSPETTPGATVQSHALGYLPIAHEIESIPSGADRNFATNALKLVNGREHDPSALTTFDPEKIAAEQKEAQRLAEKAGQLPPEPRPEPKAEDFEARKTEDGQTVLTERGINKLRSLVPSAKDLLSPNGVPVSSQQLAEARRNLPAVEEKAPAAEKKAPAAEKNISNATPRVPRLAHLPDEALQTKLRQLQQDREALQNARKLAEQHGLGVPERLSALQQAHERVIGEHEQEIAARKAQRQPPGSPLATRPGNVAPTPNTPPKNTLSEEAQAKNLAREKANPAEAATEAVDGDTIRYIGEDSLEHAGEVESVAPGRYRVYGEGAEPVKTVPFTHVLSHETKAPPHETKPATETVTGGAEKTVGAPEMASVHLEGLDEKAVQAFPEAARLVSDAAKEADVLIKGLGLTFEHYDAPTSALGLAYDSTKPDKIVVDLKQLHNEIQTALGTGGYTHADIAARVKAAISEELSHAVDDRAAESLARDKAGDEKWGKMSAAEKVEAKNRIFKDIEASLSEPEREALAKIYPHWAELAETQRGREYTRILSQAAKGGRITELSHLITDKARAFFKKVAGTIYQALGVLRESYKPGQNKMVDDLLSRANAIAEAAKGTGEKAATSEVPKAAAKEEKPEATRAPPRAATQEALIEKTLAGWTPDPKLAGRTDKTLEAQRFALMAKLKKAADSPKAEDQKMLAHITDELYYRDQQKRLEALREAKGGNAAFAAGFRHPATEEELAGGANERLQKKLDNEVFKRQARIHGISSTATTPGTIDYGELRRSARAIRAASMGAGGRPNDSEGGSIDQYTKTRAFTPSEWVRGFLQRTGTQAGHGQLKSPTEEIFAHANAIKAFIAPRKLDELAKYQIEGGVEHDVFSPPAPKGASDVIYKTTKPYDRTNTSRPFGLSHDAVDYMRYLDNLDKATDGKFKSKVLGVTLHGFEPSFVIRQNFIEGERPGSWLPGADKDSVIAQRYLEKKLVEKYGFEPLGMFKFRHKDTGIVMTDGHTGNFLEDRATGDLTPLDVHFAGDVTRPMFLPGAQRGNEVHAAGFQHPESKEAIPGFYSQLSRVVDAKMPGKIPAGALRAMLKGNGVKDDEIKWSGVDDYMKEHPTATKADLQNFLKTEGGVRVKTTELGRIRAASYEKNGLGRWQAWDENDAPIGRGYRTLEEAKSAPTTATKFGANQLPGGENYREQVFSLPEKEFLGYTSDHFPQVPSYLMHMRFNDRVDSAGKPGTFIEELQSDRHQQGREKGYTLNAAEEAERLSLRKKYHEGRINSEEQDRLGTLNEILNEREHENSNAIPDAPFRKTWHEFLIRKALADAVASGKQWLGWTTGEMQAERYSLSKQVDSIRTGYEGGPTPDKKYTIEAVKDGKKVIHKNSVPASKLSELVGKDLAQKIVAFHNTGDNYEKSGRFSGLDLKVGGAGMKHFYDEIVPQYVSKYTKKWGVKPELSNIKVPGTSGAGDAGRLQYVVHDPEGQAYDAFPTCELADAAAKDAGPGYTVKAPDVMESKQIWKLPINDKMRESIKNAGQPVFAAGFQHPEPEHFEKEGLAARTKRLDAAQKEKEEIAAKALGFPKLPEAVNKNLVDVRKAAEGVHAVSDSLAKTWIPQKRSDAAAFVGRSLSAAIAKYDNLMVQAEHAIARARAYLDRQTPEFNHSVIAAIENNREHPDPTANAFCQTFRNTNNKFRDLVRDMPNTHFKNFLVNYFPHIWAKGDVDAAKRFYQRKIEGSPAFLKHRTIPSVAEGLEAGLHLASDNPADLFMLRWSQMSKYMAGQEMLHDAVEAGILKPFTGDATALPPGMRQVDDRIGLSTVQVPLHSKDSMELPDKLAGPQTKLSPEEAAKTKTENQHYYAPESVVTLLDNHLAPGLRDKDVYKVINGMANALNQAQLGFSAFHLGFTTLDMATSKLAYGIEEAAHGNYGASAKAIASVPAQLVTPIHLLAGYFAPGIDTHIGSLISKEMDLPGSQGAEIAALAHAVIQGGGANKMDPFYANQMVRSFQKAWRTGNRFGAAWRAPFAAVEAASRPILEYIVPRQKLAVFADLARMNMRKLGPNASADEVRKAMQSAWASVDNRMGQLRYDNLYWHKTGKDVAMIAMRSVGWNIGSYREILGGLADWLKQAKNIGTGNAKEAEFTHKMAYTLALPALVGSVGAMINYLYTGEAPQDSRDIIFPRTGEKDGTGHNVRLALPSYMKDIYGFVHQPGTTLVNKANPIFTMMVDLWNNKDFYGTEIRRADDPYLEQGAEALGFTLKQFAPFAVTGAARLAQQGVPASKLALPFVGLTPANKWIDESEAELKANEINAENAPSGAKTSEQFAQHQKREALMQQLEANDPQKGGDSAKFGGILREAVAGGVIPRSEINETLKKIRMTPLEREFHSLSYENAVKVWNLATPEEKKTLAAMLRQKMARAREEGVKVDNSLLRINP